MTKGFAPAALTASVTLRRKTGLTIRCAPSEPKWVLTATHSSASKCPSRASSERSLSSFPGMLSSCFHLCTLAEAK